MKKNLLSIAILLSSQVLLSLGQNGHRIVAQICYDNLDENAKKEIDKILGDNYLAQIATWPDFIRSEKNWDFTKPWHFITIDPDISAAKAIEEAKADPKICNVVEAMELMKAILKGDEAETKRFEDLMTEHEVKPMNGSVKATALAFLVHFIGDIHQPMHVGKNNDFGGNKIAVLFFSERTNLHTVWDSGIIDQEQLGFKVFADFVDKHTAPKAAEWQNKLHPVSWAKESVEARETIYNTLYDTTDKTTGLPNLSYNYQHDFLPVIEDRLGAAGYRAAAVLNSIF